ncbi:MAG: hypothetical protein HY242_03095 [Afipia sp.]|nr:hypothetical protein [Afipia sp.]
MRTNDANKLYAVLTRMAKLGNFSARCDLADCRRARRCVGLERRCVWELPQQVALPRESVTEWRELLAQRGTCLAALRPK